MSEHTLAEPDLGRERMAYAATVARVVQLHSVSLDQLTCWVTPEVRRARDAQISIETQTSTSYQFEPASCSLIVHVSLELVGKFTVLGALSKTDDAFKISPTLRLHYSVPSPPPDKMAVAFFSAFSEINGPFNAWPFLRELVHSLAWRLGLGPITLPVQRAPEASSDVHEGKTKPRQSGRRQGKGEPGTVSAPRRVKSKSSDVGQA